ncbi:MAG TPA: serine/threonine-protein kinase [Anaerolineales bacterium]|nr:serine/threonine-protein kinase [Anaerolineales bacterium]
MTQNPSLLNNRYALQKRVGKGGMAVVYEAQDLMLERTVAIKILRETFSRDPAFRERFRQEAKAAANLTHPNIVTIHDFGYDAGRLFMIMEHVPGTDLKTVLEQRGRFSIEETIPLLVQACAGVGYAHRAGLVHCDIKPHNILITPDQRVKVTDFGIARALASIHPNEKIEVVWGSPQYFSPEQAAGRAPSPASDVYSLGVIMYEMLTGRLPFISNSTEHLAKMHRETKPLPPSQLNPKIPPVLEKILLKILSKEPSARYRTADQLGRVLLTFTSSGEIPSRPTSQVPGAVSAPGGMGQTLPGTEPVPDPDATVRSGAAPQTSSYPVQGDLGIDWISVGLGFLALLLVGGLLPFWIFILEKINQP